MRSVIVAPVFVAVAVSIPVATWWLLQLPGLSPVASTGALGASTQALQVLIVLQLLSVCLLYRYWMHSMSTIALTLIPTWPLVAMLGLAAGAPLTEIVVSQLLLLAIAFVLTLGAARLDKLLREHSAKDTLHAIVGIGAAALAWSFRSDWLGWLGI